MNISSPLLEVSYVVHNHQAEMREKLLINSIYSVHMNIYIHRGLYMI